MLVHHLEKPIRQLDGPLTIYRSSKHGAKTSGSWAKRERAGSDGELTLLKETQTETRESEFDLRSRRCKIEHYHTRVNISAPFNLLGLPFLST